MTLRVPAPPVRGPARAHPGSRTVRKIALFGSHDSSLVDAPWGDFSWEFWGHASSRAWYQRPMDRYFDLHPKACWSRGGKKTAAYPRWLAKNTTPIYMQEQYPEVPASVKYPRGQILTLFADARRYFTNQAAWMIALALSEGVTELAVFGINYSSRGEYERQRGSAEYWLGRASGAGVRVVLPDQCTLLREPALLYGYESHDEQTGALRPEYRPKEWDPRDKITPIPDGQPGQPLAEPPEEIREEIRLEELNHPRPSWALGPLGGNGQAKEA